MRVQWRETWGRSKFGRQHLRHVALDEPGTLWKEGVIGLRGRMWSWLTSSEVQGNTDLILLGAYIRVALHLTTEREQAEKSMRQRAVSEDVRVSEAYGSLRTREKEDAGCRSLG